ncbi:hypothetical protein [Psychrobacillus sp. FSL H8-0510]|uniref:hypothetical protein n=1 Tax=Psychrobacillus sp. FSL H8-0510 TaxID=2921394 RepID=UPI0030F69929
MNKFEIVHIVLALIEQNEIHQAKKVIAGKQSELRFSKVNGVREEVNELIRSIKEIDKELLVFKLKKMKLHELCPEVTIDLQSYVDGLERTRAVLAKQKMMLVRQKR